MSTHRPTRAVRSLRTESRPTQPAPEPSPLLESANPAMQRAIATARQVAPSDVAVLLTGESGTGKNVLASAIHAWSPRHEGPFVTIPCPTLADHALLEGALLRDVKGAFSESATDIPGRLESAQGGTLFLDEVGDLSLDVQAKLERILAEQLFERTGASGTLGVDARTITATKHDLEADVRAGRFREDLFFGLNVVTIALPPLRDRLEDLSALTDHILTRLAARHGRGTLRLAPEIRHIFAAYNWPGNVRELANTLERAVVLSRGEVITTEHLPDRLLAPPTPVQHTPHTKRTGRVTSFSLKELERQQIARVLAKSETLEEAAARLGINPSTLWRKRKRYGYD